MKRTFVLIAAILATPAFAGNKPAPSPKPTPATSAKQGQLQGQLQAQGQDQQQAAIASSLSASGAVATGGAGGMGVGGAGGDSGGNTLSTSYDSRDRALALALPGQTGAPAVAGECLEHLRGGSGASIGVSGRTRINRECMEFVQCVALADRYAAWGQVQLAVEQLEACGGIKGAVIAAPTTYVTQDQLERAFRDSLAK